MRSTEMFSVKLRVLKQVGIKSSCLPNAFNEMLIRHDVQVFSVRLETDTKTKLNKQFSYCREIALHGGLVLARSAILELGDIILRTL